MDIQVSKNTEIEKIRQQFDYTPYPRHGLDKFPKDNYDSLYRHNLVTPYYLRHRRVIDTTGKVILDAGCGSGFKSLMLAAANPGAKIVGIDLSEESVKLARHRLSYHGFENAEFHVWSIEDLPSLGMKFDYINCDEVLYLLPNPAAGLALMKSVLQPDGLIRANLHSLYQRTAFFKAQKLFKFLGLMDEAPQEFEEQAVIDTMKALKNTVRMKTETWQTDIANMPPEDIKEYLAMNFLFVGDTGYTIPDLFSFLEEADLEFVNMVNWRHWDVTDLFENAEELPALWDMGLATASIADKLQIYELLNPIHRLLDFWCTHPGEAGTPVDDWTDEEWQEAIVHLHPQLQNEKMKEELIRCIETGEAFEISRTITTPAYLPVFLEPSQAACLLPLWEGAQPIQAIAERYRLVRPVNPATLEPLTEAEAFSIVRDLLNRMDAFLYVLLEQR